MQHALLRHDFIRQKQVKLALKIDIEGNECELIGGAKHLLGHGKKLFFSHIALEWYHIEIAQQLGKRKYCAGNTLPNFLLEKGYV